MCGIVGYIGSKNASPILMEGLERLSYRGYDSAGVAVIGPDGKIGVRKAKGRLENLAGLLKESPVSGTIGIGHTRWATHGEPSDLNAHPHTDVKGGIAVVHNGIIENHAALRRHLEQTGAKFVSQTDTEVIAHLLNWLYDGDMKRTLIRAMGMLEGSYALGILCDHEPGDLYCARNDSPLVVGARDGEGFIASDIPALLSHTRDVIFLQDKEIAVLNRQGISVFDAYGNHCHHPVFHVDWDLTSAEKGGYAHYMLKEIHEQPEAARKTAAPRLDVPEENWLPIRPEEAKRLKKITEAEKIELDELQKQAVMEAVSNGLLIITGGPGTGKTTTINTIIHYFDQEDMEILLAAPTGRAAKRMTEATGYEAKTIHRLLELTGAPVADPKNNGNSGENRLEGMHFERNEENPLDADVIIIDEMSMVDISLIHSLLKAVNVGTRLILVGDVNQLPSVGPGNVLRDMIASEAFPVVKLTKIFRQAAQSDIIVNAHKINDGEVVPLNKKSRDFLFIRRDYPADIVKDMMVLVQDKLPNYVHAEMSDIQIMTPMRKGALGVEALNKQLQEKFNPPAPNKQEKESGGTIFRVGDKVMQIKNNYQIEWEIRNRYGIPVDKGEGVFNGDTGIIRSINSFAETMEVEFDERRMVEYSFKQLEELELAYAITIHKSQGSEYPAVVIPVHSGPRMLMTRNLIYTAVTRAKACVCLVGIPEVFQAMVDNEVEQKRYSGLKDRILEIT